MEKPAVLQGVIETPEFIKQASSCINDASRKEFINFIAARPQAGDLMVGTGGARKIRWSSDGHSGKSGGVRIVYYYHNPSIPIFLFTVYGKNVKDNITNAEKKALQVIIRQIVNKYGGDSDE